MAFIFRVVSRTLSSFEKSQATCSLRRSRSCCGGGPLRGDEHGWVWWSPERPTGGERPRRLSQGGLCRRLADVSGTPNFRVGLSPDAYGITEVCQRIRG